jgi:predicted amidohydrolase YtcJ
MKRGFLAFGVTLFLILTSCAIQSDKTTQYAPETTPVTPDLSPSDISDYPIRVRILTSSDWTTLHLLSGAKWGDQFEVSASNGAEIGEFDGENLRLTQPMGQAEEGKLVEMIADISLVKTDMATSLDVVEFEIGRGHIGWTHVQICNYLSDEPVVVGNYWWSGISSGVNDAYAIQVNASEVFDALPQGIEPKPQPVDTILCNGTIITMEEDSPQVEALAILEEDIFDIGSNKEILAFYGPETRVIDLRGRVVIPGFVDTHNHVLQIGVLFDNYEEAQQYVLSQGITSMGWMTVKPKNVKDIQAYEMENGLRVRTSLYLEYNDNCGNINGNWYLEYQPDRDPSEMVRIIGVKVFSDGDSCRQPAFSFDLPQSMVENDPRGELFLSEQELYEVISEAQSHGYQVAIHAIGDRGIETTLNAIENALGGRPNSYRHRIEHNYYLRPNMLQRYGEIGVIPVMFGICHTCIWSRYIDNPGWDEFIDIHGDRVQSWILPSRSLIDSNPGLHVTWHTDTTNYPGVGGPPIKDLWRLVTRKEIRDDVEEVCEPTEDLVAGAVSVEQALRMMTIEGAYALFMEDKVGSLRPGKYADLVILSDNPITVSPNSILDIEVLITMVGGHVEYCAPGYLDIICDILNID